MKKLIMDRATGKTTAMIYTSACTGAPILCSFKAQGDRIKAKAKELGMAISDPVYTSDEFRGTKLNAVLIDDADLVLRDLVKKVVGADLMAFTMTKNDD